MLIPLKVDVPMDRRPWVNYALIAITVVVSIAAWMDIDGIFLPLAGFGTSCLLHVGLIHLIGNMLFLWIFGNAVNYKFGHLGYLGLYVAAALSGDLAHDLFSGGIAVGASGAIYGVMGAFLVYFLRNDITVLFVLFIFYVRMWRFSSGWIILFWVAWNVFYLAIGADTGVAFWGHVGGFAAGFGVALTCAFTGLIKPTQDEQSLLQVLKIRP